MNLPEALRALPMQAPERSAWPELVAALRREQAPPRRRRYVLPIALAAAVVLAFVAAFALRQRASDPQPIVATVAQPAASKVENAANGTNVKNVTTSENPIDANAKLVALQDRSQALEHWLRETGSAATPLNGQDLAAVAEIEDMIGLVDVQLEANSHANEVALWRRRVALLEDLTALRYSSYTIAERGVAANTAAPTTWTN